MKKSWGIVISVLICELIGISGAFFTMPSIPTWYKTLNKPFFSPPNWLFGPVWTILYLMMGISAYLIWEKGLKNKKVKEALLFFAVQLILNFSWSLIFFGLQLPFSAFINIITLWLAILVTILRFNKISKTAGYLLIPYLLWVSFASVLNLAIVILNK